MTRLFSRNGAPVQGAAIMVGTQRLSLRPRDGGRIAGRTPRGPPSVEARHSGQASPCTQIGALSPGIGQHVVPTPHALHGHALHLGGAKYPRQLPPAHTWLTAQALPHAPQLSGSFWSCAALRQAPPQLCRPIEAQLSAWQTPSTHEPLHPALQAPQFSSSAVRSTQAPPHRVRPTRQAHAPASQYSASEQGMPQDPQLLGLVCVLTQAPPQVSPPEQPHVPPAHVAPCSQEVVQPPQ